MKDDPLNTLSPRRVGKEKPEIKIRDLVENPIRDIYKEDLAIAKTAWGYAQEYSELYKKTKDKSWAQELFNALTVLLDYLRTSDVKLSDLKMTQEQHSAVRTIFAQLKNMFDPPKPKTT